MHQQKFLKEKYAKDPRVLIFLGLVGGKGGAQNEEVILLAIILFKDSLVFFGERPLWKGERCLR